MQTLYLPKHAFAMLVRLILGLLRQSTFCSYMLLIALHVQSI